MVLSPSFADVQRKGLVGITLEFFLLNSVKWDIKKMGWKMGLVPPCRNYLVSIYDHIIVIIYSCTCNLCDVNVRPGPQGIQIFFESATYM